MKSNITNTLSAISATALLALAPIASAGEHCAEGVCPISATQADSNLTSLAVTGMTCQGCSHTVKTLLTETDGVSEVSVDHKTGNVAFAIDDEKANKTAIITAINETGFKVTGENHVIPVAGMSCEGCSNTLTTALTALDGITVNSVCLKSSHASLTIDPAKANKAQAIAAIEKTGFKIATTAVAPVTEASQPEVKEAAEATPN